MKTIYILAVIFAAIALIGTTHPQRGHLIDAAIAMAGGSAGPGDSGDGSAGSNNTGGSSGTSGGSNSGGGSNGGTQTPGLDGLAAGFSPTTATIGISDISVTELGPMSAAPGVPASKPELGLSKTDPVAGPKTDLSIRAASLGQPTKEDLEFEKATKALEDAMAKAEKAYDLMNADPRTLSRTDYNRRTEIENERTAREVKDRLDREAADRHAKEAADSLAAEFARTDAIASGNFGQRNATAGGGAMGRQGSSAR